MALKRKLQGREQSKSRDEAIYKETWYGTEAEVDAYIATLVIGVYVQDKGYLHEWEKKQDSPAIWEVEVTYRVTYTTWTTEEEESSSSSSTPKQYTLSVRNIQTPLEAHPLYKACWNHYLLGYGTLVVPAWWSTATNTMLTKQQHKFYTWVSSLSEIPIDEENMDTAWQIVREPTKPGVSTYDVACFVVVEKSRYKTSSQAGQAISTNINTINTPPHTFGITGGNWKLDEGSVEHDGKRWVATRSWTHASGGWDTDLYGNGNNS